MEKIKVLEVIRQGQIGGGESHVVDLVDGFDLNIIEPIVMSFTTGHMIDTLQKKGIKCYVIETQKAFDPKVFKKITNVVRNENIKIIHAHGSRAASNMLWSAWKLHLPLVYTVHGWSFHQNQNPLIQKIRALCEKLICKRSNKVICVSESNRVTGKEMFGLNNAIVIENGINLHRFNYQEKYKNLREELHIQKDSYIIGLIARMTLQKNPIVFLQAIEKAHTINQKIIGLVIGEGEMDEEVKNFIINNNMQDYIVKTPFRTDIPAVLKTIDVYCLPSLWEGLSIALLEAMAMAKPIVATPTDGTSEVIKNNGNGIIVDFNDSSKLSDAFIYFYNNPSTAKEYGKNALQLIEKRFNSQRVSDEVTNIYKQLIKDMPS
jgi:glycosyltransferase involved in cell wall biosynthesis